MDRLHLTKGGYSPRTFVHLRVWMLTRIQTPAPQGIGQILQTRTPGFRLNTPWIIHSWKNTASSVPLKPYQHVPFAASRHTVYCFLTLATLTTRFSTAQASTFLHPQNSCVPPSLGDGDDAGGGIMGCDVGRIWGAAEAFPQRRPLRLAPPTSYLQSLDSRPNWVLYRQASGLVFRVKRL